MGLFTRPDSDPKKLHAVIERVWPLVVTYSQTLAEHSTDGFPRPMSLLPFPKKAISDAMLEWLTLLSKPNTLRTLEMHMPALVEEVASAEAVESLIVQYLMLCYFIPDRDAQIFRQLATGDFTGLSDDDVERRSTIVSGFMYDRGEREEKLKRLGYSVRDV